MLIALYTSRLLLKALGIDDFGIYNVVGGVVMLFSFLNSTLVVSSQRFLNYEMGKGNYTGINEVFCTSVNIQLLIAIIIFMYLANLHTSFLCNLIYPTFITLSVYIN